LRTFNGAEAAAPVVELPAAMPRVDMRVAAAPATMAVAKFRLVIIIVIPIV
jgi:hypothetical protein